MAGIKSASGTRLNRLSTGNELRGGAVRAMGHDVCPLVGRSHDVDQSEQVPRWEVGGKPETRRATVAALEEILRADPGAPTRPSSASRLQGR